MTSTTDWRSGRVLLAAMGVPVFRWLLVGRWSLSGVFASESLVQGWLVLQLTDSPLWLGVAVTVRGVSGVVFALVGGAIADRAELRWTLATCQAISACVAAVIALLVSAGVIQLWHVMLGLVVTGAINSIRSPGLDILTQNVVGDERLLNANALGSFAYALGRMSGGLLGGLLVGQFGVAAGYFLAAAFYVVGGLALLRLPSMRRAVLVSPALQSLREGVNYVRRKGPIRELLLLSLVAEYFGYAYLPMLPAVARDVLRVGATELGYLYTAAAAGSLAAAAILAAAGDMQRKGDLVVIATIGFGASNVLLAVSPSLALSILAIFLVGAAGSLFMTGCITVLQMNIATEIRGRVLGFYNATSAAYQLSGVGTGALASVFTVPVALALSGSVLVGYAVRAWTRREILHSRLVSPTFSQ